jgi:hypothetical protein
MNTYLGFPVPRRCYTGRPSPLPESPWNRSTKKRYPELSLPVAFLVFTLLQAVLCVPGHAAQFPEDRPEFNGLAIDYTLTGVSIDSGTDSGDFNWWKHLSGKVTGKTVTFSGTVHGYNSKFPDSGQWASTTTVGVSITAGSEHAEQTIHSTDDPATEGKTWSRPFSVSVKVPDDAQSVTISVGESGSYGNGEARGLGVDGTFTNPSYDPNAKPLSSSSSGSGTDLPLLPLAAGVVLLGGGALAVKMITGRPKAPVTPQPPHVPSKEEHKQKTRARREHIKNEMENDRALAKHYRQMGKAYGATGEKMETLEKGADFGVNVLEKMTGPAGKVIKTGYVAVKDVTKNMSSSYAKGESLWKGAARGGLEAGFDLGFDHLKKKLPSGPGNWEFKGSDTKVTTGLADGLKSATQSLGVKTVIKDPIKTVLKGASDKILGKTLGTFG